MASVSRIVIVGAAIATALLFFAPFSVPTWAVAAFVLVIFVMGIVVSVKRMRAEQRVVRAIWQALTRSGSKLTH